MTNSDKNMIVNLNHCWNSCRVRIGTELCFVEGNFKTAACLLRRGNILLALLYQGLKLADITSAVTVLKITHFTDGAGGCLGGDRFAGNSQMAINNCKVLTLTGHGRGLFASGEKAAGWKWQSQASTPLQLNTTSGLLQKLRGPWRHGMCRQYKNVGKTGLIFGRKKACPAKSVRNQATDCVRADCGAWELPPLFQ